MSPEILEQCSSNLAPEERASQKKQNDTYYVVAMATLLAPVSFREKTVILICNLLMETEGVARNTHDFHTVLTLPIRLLYVDDPCLK